MTPADEVAEALREVDSWCVCSACQRHPVIPPHQCSELCLCCTERHAAARKLAEVARKAGREESIIGYTDPPVGINTYDR